MKRQVDLLIAFAALTLLWPMFLFLIVAIRLDTDGPAIFSQERLGKDQKPFRCLKFRSMKHGATGDAWTAVDDPRITRVGRLMRAAHMDEIPQLINVIRGEMSIVGPRPLVEQEATLFGATTPPHSRRFDILPGITGLAQVLVAPDAHQAKFRLDTFYVENRSMRLDLIVMAQTALKLLMVRSGARLLKERLDAERSEA